MYLRQEMAADEKVYSMSFAEAPQNESESKKDNRHNLRHEGREYRRTSYAGNKVFRQTH